MYVYRDIQLRLYVSGLESSSATILIEKVQE